MDKERFYEVEAFIDTIPNLLKSGMEQQVKEILSNQLKNKLPLTIKRYKDLHYLMFETRGIFLQFLMEARRLYVENFDWAAVALCGMTVEAICVSIINERVMEKDTRTDLMRLDCRKQIETIKDKLRIRKSASIMHKILDLRNDYIHLKRKKPDPTEVLECLNRLHLVVIAEYGLVPWKNGKVRMSNEEDIKHIALKIGL